MSAYSALLKADVRNMRRDPTFGFMLIAPFLMGSALRFLLPAADELLKMRFGFDLGIHFPALIAFFIQIPALMAGMMIGLLFLEERDGGLMDAYAVVPLGRGGYVGFRVAETGVMGLAFTVVVLLLLLPVLDGTAPSAAAPVSLQAVGAALLPGCLSGPLVALFLILFAQDRVSGLALAKLSSLPLGVLPLWYFLDHPGRALLNVFYPVPILRAWLAVLVPRAGTGAAAGMSGAAADTGWPAGMAAAVPAGMAVALQLILLCSGLLLLRRAKRLPARPGSARRR